MPRKGHVEEQIGAVLQQAESSAKAGELCRKLSISQATFYKWKKQYAGLGVQELRELCQLREEYSWLKRMVADLALDRQILQEICKKGCKAPPQTPPGEVDTVGVSDIGAACHRVVGMHRSTCRYRNRAPNQNGLRLRLKELGATHVRYGYRRLKVLLNREGWPANAKRIYRLYREEGADRAHETAQEDSSSGT